LCDDNHFTWFMDVHIWTQHLYSCD
jgi:hypothetical protein